jgi:hypothetical protein
MTTSQSQDGWAKSALRLPRDVHQLVHHTAKLEDRTYNGQIVAMLRESLNRRQEQAQPAAATSGDAK